MARPYLLPEGGLLGLGILGPPVPRLPGEAALLPGIIPDSFWDRSRLISSIVFGMNLVRDALIKI